jgi:hypothetical protein
MIVGQEKPSLDSLTHYGVKGMKWGVRREKPNVDLTLKKGQKVYNVSGGTVREHRGIIFGAHENRDIANYRSEFASNRKMSDGKAFSNEFIVKKNIKVASEKAQVEMFANLWNTDREKVVNALAVSQKDMKIGAAIMSTVFHKDRTAVYEKRLAAKGEEWVRRKGYSEFTRALGTKNSDAVAALYQKEMTKRGYAALMDTNDIKLYGSKAPIIYFKADKTLSKGSSVEISPNDINRAFEAYYREKSLKSFDPAELHKKS